MRLFKYTVFVLVVLAPTMALAADGGTIETLIEGMGFGQALTLGLLILVSVLRAAAATLSKHVPDGKLGAFSGVVNAIGGNGKHAANIPEG